MNSNQENRKSHWESIFEKNDYTQVLWYEKSPKTSLSLFEKYADRGAKILDAGCGASFLVDNLLELEYKDITLLDTSKKSLDIVKKRVDKSYIQYVCSDILDYSAEEKFDIWHDRAVFHFLLLKEEREIYFEVLESSLSATGSAIISTFRVDGPEACAGLEIVQYDEEKMSAEIPNTLKIVEVKEYEHITFKDTKQKYIYFVIQKI